ncbi:MAG: peptide-methionine (S)-S-oxide reductase MsrA [Rhodobacterales bacterium]|nr:peptide-methionine (S)-S-oxide reductase MsrA [Rhodobacterales bacterium]
MLSFLSRRTPQMVTAETALPGRAQAITVPELHAVNGHKMKGPWPRMAELFVGMGCFWGAERKFWQQPGVHVTSVGYQGGFSENPTYEETCTGRTGHTEVVHVVYDPAITTLAAMLKVFWENHDPTQGMRQGNDSGTQYRSALFLTSDADLAAARVSKAAYEAKLVAAGHGVITTEVGLAPTYYYGEDYHQQYLHKNPSGYCSIGGTGVSCPSGISDDR